LNDASPRLYRDILERFLQISTPERNRGFHSQRSITVKILFVPQ
jgi:hypothetical protein